MDHSGNVLDYLNWRGDLTFAQDGFNEVDNLVLCIISYINFRRVERLRSREPAQAMTLGEVCALLSEKDEQLGLSNLDYIPVLRAASETVRFGAVRMYGYECSHDDEREMQFAAVSFLLPDETLFIAFMGTDRSLVGWKEDLNMSYLSAIPAQQRAAAYAEVMAATARRRKIRLGGHSKGGNLAVWAAMHLPERIQSRRLLAAYNNDGPGFLNSVLETEEYRRIADRIHTFIPESSVVGVLLDHAEDYDVIDSSNRAIMQHEPMSWSVLGSRFVHLGERSQLGKLSDGVMREWVGSMTPEERENPKLLGASRKKRVAAGCGLEVVDVNRLLKQFEMMQDLVKQMTRGRMPKGLGGFGGKGGMSRMHGFGRKKRLKYWDVG